MWNPDEGYFVIRPPAPLPHRASQANVSNQVLQGTGDNRVRTHDVGRSGGGIALEPGLKSPAFVVSYAGIRSQFRGGEGQERRSFDLRER